MKLRHSTIPAESSITELANSNPARPHHGPKDFTRTLRALLSLLKASSEPSRPRVRASFGRRGKEGLTPINKTARDYAETKRGLKKQIQEREAPFQGLPSRSSRKKAMKSFAGKAMQPAEKSGLQQNRVTADELNLLLSASTPDLPWHARSCRALRAWRS